MMLFVLTFVMLLGMCALMSVGVVFSGKRLRGSCGGVGSSCACDEAGRPRACEAPSSAGELSEPRGAGPAPGDDASASMASLPAPGQHGFSQHLRSGALPER